MKKKQGSGLMDAFVELSFEQAEKHEKLKAKHDELVQSSVELAEEFISLEEKDSNITKGRRGGSEAQRQHGDDRKEICIGIAERIREVRPDWAIDAAITKIQKTIKKNIKSDKPEFNHFKTLYKNGEPPSDTTVRKFIGYLWESPETTDFE